jgi:hypothetical protein
MAAGNRRALGEIGNQQPALTTRMAAKDQPTKCVASPLRASPRACLHF